VPRRGHPNHWIGFADPDCRIEIREPSLVKPEFMIKGWDLMGQPYSFVKDEDEWLMYYMLGGHALAEKGIAESHLRTTLVAGQCVRTEDAEHGGFTSLAGLPETALNRAPTPRLRMRVFDRDSRRCRICGRSPANHVDVELHTHHIRPWASGGLTVMENLITLCHTCHKGLEPHFDKSLFDHLPRNQEETDFSESVMRHRFSVLRALHEFGSRNNSRKRQRQS